MNVLRFWNILSSGIMLWGAFLFGYQIWKYETFTFLSSIGVLIFIIIFLVYWDLLESFAPSVVNR